MRVTFYLLTQTLLQEAVNTGLFCVILLLFI